MTRRLIVTGTREELSAEDRAMATDLILRAAAWADEVGVGDRPTGIDALARRLVPGARVFESRDEELDWLLGAGATERWIVGFVGPGWQSPPGFLQEARAHGMGVLIKRVGGAR